MHKPINTAIDHGRRTANAANAPNQRVRGVPVVDLAIRGFWKLNTASIAGTAVKEKNRPNSTPTPVKMPKARTGARGENAKEKKPIAAVTEVAATGSAIV